MCTVCEDGSGRIGSFRSRDRDFDHPRKDDNTTLVRGYDRTTYKKKERKETLVGR